MSDLNDKRTTKVLEVVGSRVKVKVNAAVETKSAGGFYLPPEGQTEDQETGVVVQMGHLAYLAFETTGNWCNIGDTVLFARYSGKPREEIGEDGKLGYYRVLPDRDIIGIIREKEIITLPSGKEEVSNG